MGTADIVLDKWQEDLLKDEGNILLCTGRQVGKSTIMSIKVACYLMKHPESRVIIVSLTEDQAKLIIIMILDYLEKHYKSEIAKGKLKPTQNKLTLKNGSSALARPVGTTGDAVRGFTGDVLVIDECSRMPELAMTASKPTLLTTGGKLWICSTPYGKQGFFYETFLNKNERFNVFHISSEDVIKNRPLGSYWTQEKRDAALQFLKEEKADMSELQYGQEYMGLFIDELRQYFSDELIERVCTLKRDVSLKIPPNLYLGVDLARLGGDQCSYEIIRKCSAHSYEHIENITKKEQLTTKTERDLIELNQLWTPRAIGIDAGAGSLGVGIYDRLMETKGIRYKVVAMNNRTISMDREGKKLQRIFKEDMYDNLLSMLEKDELKLLNDPDVKLSLKSVQWEFIEVGSVSKVRIFGKFTHIAEGLTRSAWLAKKAKINKLWITCK